jgi:hypothetical protein
MPTQTAYLDPNNPTTKMLKAMVELDPAFVPTFGSIMASLGTPRIPADVARYTFGPLIVHCAQPSATKGDIGWLTRDLIEKWHPRVNIERVEILCGERPDLVSPAELWMVLYNAMMDSPMPRDLTELYLWAQHRALTASGFAPEDKLHALKATCQIPSDDAVFGGSWGLNREYQNLAAEIRRKVITHAKPLGRRLGRWNVAVR